MKGSLSLGSLWPIPVYRSTRVRKAADAHPSPLASSRNSGQSEEDVENGVTGARPGAGRVRQAVGQRVESFEPGSAQRKQADAAAITRCQNRQLQGFAGRKSVSSLEPLQVRGSTSASRSGRDEWPCETAAEKPDPADAGRSRAPQKPARLMPAYQVASTVAGWRFLPAPLDRAARSLPTPHLARASGLTPSGPIRALSLSQWLVIDGDDRQPIALHHGDWRDRWRPPWSR